MSDFEQSAPGTNDEPGNNETPYRRHRLMVVCLLISFLACLIALGITGNLFGVPGGLLPATYAPIVTIIIRGRIELLLIPLLCLLCCYALLRHITHDIMATPERYLDERQKQVRDEAHRSAYKYIKLACLIVPLLFCLHALFWTSAAPSTISTVMVSRPADSTVVYEFSQRPIKSSNQHIRLSGALKAPGPLVSVYDQAGSLIGLKVVSIIMNDQPYVIHTVTNQPVDPTLWPSDPASMLLYYGVLLLALLLIVVALPKSIVAWKERL